MTFARRRQKADKSRKSVSPKAAGEHSVLEGAMDAAAQAAELPVLRGRGRPKKEKDATNGSLGD